MQKFIAFIQMIITFLMSIFGIAPKVPDVIYDTNFTIPSIQSMTDNSVYLNGSDCSCTVSGGKIENGKMFVDGTATLTFDGGTTDYYNYFGFSYSSEANMKCVITYKSSDGNSSEEFFLEQGENLEFYSLTDGFLDKEQKSDVISLTFECLAKSSANITIYGMSTFLREVPDSMQYISNDKLKAGINLEWGGALSYLEDLDSSVQEVIKNNTVYVDANASSRYNSKSVNDHVNLINCHDTGRLIQQSYYGTRGDNDSYTPAIYNKTTWQYNPVQGGNTYGDKSKIVDINVSSDSIYVKCRPLDWAQHKEFITPSYMEATYTLDGGTINTECRFIDFSGYTPVRSEQELPAFYTLSAFSRYVYYSGTSTWQNDPTLTVRDDLTFWPDMGYPHFNTTENWSAFMGEFDDSFGVGVYSKGRTSVLAGISKGNEKATNNPATMASTSYIGVTATRTFRSFVPMTYSFSIATGTTDEIRSEFSRIHNS